MNTDWVMKNLWDFTRAHVISSVRGKEDREDLIHDILVLYLEMAGRYSVPPEEFLKLAKTSARNKVRDFIRRRVVRVRILPSDPCFIERSDSIDLGRIEARIILGSIRSRLKFDTQTVFDALYYGLGPTEVIEESGMGKTTFYRKVEEIKEAGRGNPAN